MRVERYRMIGWLFLSALAWATPTGWLHDGTARVPTAAAPLHWSDSEVQWRMPLSAKGNGTPVLAGDDLVCFTEEPTWLVCADASTGQERWRAENSYLDTLSGAEKASWTSKLESVSQRQEDLRSLQRDLSQLRRQLRRDPENEELQETFGALNATYTQRSLELDALLPYAAASDIQLIGYATPSPLFDGERLYTLTGHGVLAAYDLAGQRLWSSFVGPAPARMRGWDLGTTASLRMVDGLLIVPYRTLRGIDPTTGKTVWEGPPYQDFGTPAVGTVGGLPVVITPDGRVVHGKTGDTLAVGLGDTWYVGPLLKDDIVYFIGGFGNGQQPGNTTARAVKLSRDGEGIGAQTLWNIELPSSERLYASPLIKDQTAYIFNEDKVLMVLDLSAGEVTRMLNMAAYLSTYVFMQPMLVGGKIVVGSQTGNVVVLDPDDNLAVVAMQHLKGFVDAIGVYKGRDRWIRFERELVKYREPSP